MDDLGDHGIPVVAVDVHEDAVAAFDEIVVGAGREGCHDRALGRGAAGFVEARALGVEQAELAGGGHVGVGGHVLHGQAEAAGAAVDVERAGAEGDVVAQAVEVVEGDEVLEQLVQVQVEEHELGEVGHFAGALGLGDVLLHELVELVEHAAFEELPGLGFAEGVEGPGGVGGRRKGAGLGGGDGRTRAEGVAEGRKGRDDFLPVLVGNLLLVGEQGLGEGAEGVELLAPQGVEAGCNGQIGVGRDAGEGQGRQGVLVQRFLLQRLQQLLVGVEGRLGLRGEGGKPAAQEEVLDLGGDFLQQGVGLLGVLACRQLAGGQRAAPVDPVLEGAGKGFAELLGEAGRAGGVLGAADHGQARLHEFLHLGVEVVVGGQDAVAVEELAGNALGDVGHVGLGDQPVLGLAKVAEDRRGCRAHAHALGRVVAQGGHGQALAGTGDGRFVVQALADPVDGIEHFGHADAAVAVLVEQLHGVAVEFEALGRAAHGAPELGIKFAQVPKLRHAGQNDLVVAAHALEIPCDFAVCLCHCSSSFQGGRGACLERFPHPVFALQG